uniref:Limbic system-associated membrane protein n=1 Tax=Steinernema glaseri TaxID=37863 RepID=A0A1I7Z377_9BILA
MTADDLTRMNTNPLSLLLLICQFLPTSPQVITTIQRTFVVDEGDTVDLPCNIEELDTDHAVVIWKRERDTILFLDEERLEQDQRLQLLKSGHNYTLSIQNVEPYDAATYYCGITANADIEIAHTLKVQVPPTISISPQASPLLVKQNEDVSLRCLASGNPQPKVSWRKKSNIPFSSATKTLDGRLKIKSVQVGDSGTYECVATNGVRGSISKEIELVVQSAPWVETDNTYIPVSPHANANLTCRYNGQPIPEAEWWYNSFKINKYDKKFENVVEYGVRRNNYSEAVLQLTDIDEEDYGQYTCRISNGLGSVEKTIHLSGMSSCGQCVMINKMGTPDICSSLTLFLELGYKYSMSIPHSAEPVTEYKIMYRKASEDNWNKEHVIRASRDQQHGSLWEHKVDVTTFLPPGTEYALQLKAKNTLGYGSLAQNYVTTTTPVRRIEQRPGNNVPSFSTGLSFVLASLLFFLF